MAYIMAFEVDGPPATRNAYSHMPLFPRWTVLRLLQDTSGESALLYEPRKSSRCRSCPLARPLSINHHIAAPGVVKGRHYSSLAIEATPARAVDHHLIPKEGAFDMDLGLKFLQALSGISSVSLGLGQCKEPPRLLVVP